MSHPGPYLTLNLKHKLKERNKNVTTALHFSHSRVFNNEHNECEMAPSLSSACRWGIALYCTCHNNVNNEMFHFLLLVDIELGLLVFDFTFNNFSIILWQSFLLMEKSRVPLNNMKERNIVFDICRWYRIWWNSICTSNINSNTKESS